MPGEILRPDFKKTEKNKSREIGSSFSLKDENIARKIATRSLEREGHDFFYYINLDEQEENKEENSSILKPAEIQRYRPGGHTSHAAQAQLFELRGDVMAHGGPPPLYAGCHTGWCWPVVPP